MFYALDFTSLCYLLCVSQMWMRFVNEVIMRSPAKYSMFFSLQGCYSAVVDYFEAYIYMAGALAIVVLTIEVRSQFGFIPERQDCAGKAAHTLHR